MWRICLYVLLAASLASGSVQCPEWLTEYEAFHAQARGKQGTRYLVHSVDETGGGGLGDRLKGALFTLRAAAPLRRVVLFEWLHPNPLTDSLEPSGRIDWRLDGIEYERGRGQVLRFRHNEPAPQVEDGSLAGVEDQFVTFHVSSTERLLLVCIQFTCLLSPRGQRCAHPRAMLHATPSALPLPLLPLHSPPRARTPSTHNARTRAPYTGFCPLHKLQRVRAPHAPCSEALPLTPRPCCAQLQTNRAIWAKCWGCQNLTFYTPEALCVWNSVFRLRSDIISQAQQHLQRLYSEPSPSYAALHLRLGGLTGEGELRRKRAAGSPLEIFIAAIRCANKLAAASNIEAPILVVTDNHALREFIKVDPHQPTPTFEEQVQGTCRRMGLSGMCIH